MHTLYLLSVTLHIVAAMAWVGGMLFLVLVVVPMLRKPALRERALELMHVLGVRFRLVGWIAIGTLVLTGIFNVLYRGFSFGSFFDGSLYQGQWGRILATKLGLVAVVLTMSAVHDFWIGPKATRLASIGASAEVREKYRVAASVMGRVAFAFALAIVALAVTLVRG
jgi:putative copper export protein